MRNEIEVTKLGNSVTQTPELDDIFSAYRLSRFEQRAPAETEDKKDAPIPREKALDVQAKELAEVIKKSDGTLDKKSEDAMSKLLEKVYEKGEMQKLMDSFRANLKGSSYVLSLRINPDDDEHYYLQIGKNGSLVGGSVVKFKAKH